MKGSHSAGRDKRPDRRRSAEPDRIWEDASEQNDGSGDGQPDPRRPAASPERRRTGVSERNAAGRAPAPRSGRGLARAGWIFLALVILAVGVAAYFLLIRQGEDPADPGLVWEPGEWLPSLSDDSGEQTEATGGVSISVNGIQCAFEQPQQLEFGVQKALDLTGIAQTVCDNAQAAGWGEIIYSQSSDGSLIFYRRNAGTLSADELEQQKQFQESGRSEDYARTFLTDCGLYGLLQGYGISLSTQAENNEGEILFSGQADGPLSQCLVRLNFFYTGALNQMKVYAVHLDGAVTVPAVPLEEAVKYAVSWTSPGGEPTQVTQATVRYIRGIPFYDLLCADGTQAYALAVAESDLAANPEAEALYRQLMESGIQEYVQTDGPGI